MGHQLLRALRAWTRWSVVGADYPLSLRDKGQTYLYTFWHCHLLTMLFGYPGVDLTFLVSHHPDGEVITRVMSRFGIEAIRGSRTRGGAMALRQMIRALRTGKDVAFTPDGPKGPARKIGPGLIQTARLSGSPILPVAVGFSRSWKAPTWDRLVIPEPFTTGVFVFGEPVWVPKSISEEEENQFKHVIQNRLETLERTGVARASGLQ